VTNQGKSAMNGTKEIAQRLVNAELDFVATVQEITGCTREEGFKALVTMKRLKVVKLDAGIGRYQVKHGAYMEAQALRNAIAY
jgi:hypothetical protein